MPFFARPNLDDIQFKQLTGTTLTLSGETRIANPVGGLAFVDEFGRTIPVVVTGASGQDVLTYVSGSSGVCLTLSQPTSGASTGVYLCKSPTTCTVGGLPTGSPIYNCPIDYILERILVPTIQPTKVEPSATFSLSCFPSAPTGYYEIGTSISVTGSSTFSRGCAMPWYDSGGTCIGASTPRSGLPFAYCYTFPTAVSISCSGLNYTHVFTTHNIVGNETYTNKVFYLSGQTILNSAGSGATFTTTCTCPSGVISRNITRYISLVLW